jgi:nucleotide-binding universal stress UspA family protein
MYTRILVPVEHSDYDAAIVGHVGKLALHTSASVVLIHVADGYAARNAEGLALRESEEMRVDRVYLESLCADMEKAGVKAECVLAGGDPAKEISAAAIREKCDLIAMGTHGHRFVKDVLYGSVANEVRHISRIPVLLVRADRETPA